MNPEDVDVRDTMNDWYRKTAEMVPTSTRDERHYWVVNLLVRKVMLQDNLNDLLVVQESPREFDPDWKEVIAELEEEAASIDQILSLIEGMDGPPTPAELEEVNNALKEILEDVYVKR